MRLAQVLMGAVILFSCLGSQGQTQTQKMTVTGKLTHVMAIGGESTGWAIELESGVTVDRKQVNFIEVSYADTKKLEALENKLVKATGRLSHRQGVETGERTVLDISSVKEVKAK
jgi:hypothetical protein